MLNKEFYIILGLILLVLICSIVYRLLSIRYKSLVLVLVSSTLLEIVISPLRGYVSFTASMLAGFVLFIIFTYFALKRLKLELNEWKVLTAIIIGVILINAERFFNFSSSLISLPDEIFRFLGILVGYAIYKIKNYIKWVIVLIASILCGYMYVVGYDMWLNKLNFGTFTGEIKYEKISKKISFADSKGAMVNLNNLSGKIIILDFWNTKCGVCYSKFSEVQKVYDKYKNNTKVCFYSVNSFLEEIDKDIDAFRIIKERGYNFPILICKEKSVLEELKIIAYPTVLIISKNGELIFRGDINKAENKIENLLKENY